MHKKPGNMIRLITLILLVITTISPLLADPLHDCIFRESREYEETFGSVPMGENFDAIMRKCYMQVYGIDPNYLVVEPEPEIDPLGFPDDVKNEIEIDPMGIPASPNVIYIGPSPDDKDTIPGVGTGTKHVTGDRIDGKGGLDTIAIPQSPVNGSKSDGLATIAITPTPKKGN